MRRPWPWVGAGISIIALALATRPEVRALDAVDEGCPQTSTTTDHQGTSLQSFVGTGNASIVYDVAHSSLKLAKSAGVFRATSLPITDLPSYICPADYDKDGWVDFVGAGAFNTFIKLYKNRTYDNAAPDWTDSTKVRTPKFVTTTYPTIQSGTANGDTLSAAIGGIACGDFNGDGNADFLFVNKGNDQTIGTPTAARLWKGNGNGTFQSPYQFVSSLSALAKTSWSNNGTVVDYNGDGKLDLIFGLATDSATGGKVQVFLNNGSTTTPMFVAGAVLLNNAGMGYRGSHEVAYGDFTGDGRKDLVATGASTNRLRLYPGLAGGGVDQTYYQTISFPVGSASTLFAGDLTLDGKLDLVIGTDNFNLGCGSSPCTANTGGYTYVYQNNGTATPFSSGVTQTLTNHSAISDLDVGAPFDYDHDPDGTLDFIIADGNTSQTYYVFANRMMSQYVACGDVASGVLDLGALADDEMVVTAARLSPTATLPSGTSISYYMSNENPVDWQLAAPCVDDATDYCVSFPDPVGRSVSWKATMCSNSGKTTTPELSQVAINFDYTEAEEHFRGGVVVDDGVAYVGAFRQPGDRGHFYATNAGLSQIYWDGGTRLDGMNDADRKIYTAATDGTTRLDFETTRCSSSALQTTLGVASEAQAQSVVSWQRSARFGITGGGHVRTRLGAVETSTPAVLSPPTRPLWYEYLTSQRKQEVDVFIQRYQNRPVLVLFGSKDGPLHAVRNRPADISDVRNGTEAWAFIPPRVASGLVADQAASGATSFVDGSPTLADVQLGDGALHTVAIVSGGNGSHAVFALDVTNTVNRDSGAVTGPDPMWEILPGDALAGLGRAKPAVARVRIDGAERYIAILATGLDRSNPTPPYTKGRDVVAVDVGTGQRLWRFKTACPVTSDPVVFETDDEAEPGSPALDGYMDRLILADACGYVYKLDPAVNLPGSGTTDGWIDSSAFGSIATATTDAAGRPVEALFSSQYTSGAIGGQRPIAGTIGTRTDATGRVVLFFGTGGLENFDPSMRNEFYAVYADTGAIRNKIVGDCSAGTCEKFYGGVVVSTDQVILTRATDPPIGTASCELGSSEVTGVDIDTLSTELTVTTGSATVSALYGHAGAVYFTTLAGDLVRVGTPAAAEAGGESSGGNGNGNGNGDGGDDDDEPTSNALGIMGWRQVL